MILVCVYIYIYIYGFPNYNQDPIDKIIWYNYTKMFSKNKFIYKGLINQVTMVYINIFRNKIFREIGTLRWI